MHAVGPKGTRQGWRASKRVRLTRFKASAREALGALRALGLVRTRTGPGGGVFVAELDFRSVLAELCPNPVLAFACGFMQGLLRGLVICQRIYDTSNPALRENALRCQV